MKDLIERMMLEDVLKGFFQRETKITAYNSFTNEKYLSMERVNTMFSLNFLGLSSTKIIITGLTFILLNWVFYRLFDYRVSKLFRVFSFKLYFVEMILLGEISNVFFLAFHSSKMLFMIEKSSI